MSKCRYHPIPIAIASIYTLILYISSKITTTLGLGLPCINPYGLPLTIALAVPPLIVSRETITLMGGPREYFCSGAEVIHNLLTGKNTRSNGYRIIVEGPFSVTRHPVYTSTLLLTIAITITIPCTLPAIILVAAWVYAASQLEERELVEYREYREYRARTPRFSLHGIIVYGYAKLLKRGGNSGEGAERGW
ncbi:MAG: hypothetical protein GSR86_02815 [Desulfurococcales archaeon]|nr:hypothetical protein [Desulfurococcales archaeon]